MSVLKRPLPPGEDGAALSPLLFFRFAINLSSRLDRNTLLIRLTPGFLDITVLRLAHEAQG
jgi:hypothetical protein